MSPEKNLATASPHTRRWPAHRLILPNAPPDGRARAFVGDPRPIDRARVSSARPGPSSAHTQWGLCIAVADHGRRRRIRFAHLAIPAVGSDDA
jgi:hypothetical protein